jgi:hypothetical protein
LSTLTKMFTVRNAKTKSLVLLAVGTLVVIAVIIAVRPSAQPDGDGMGPEYAQYKRAQQQAVSDLVESLDKAKRQVDYAERYRREQGR